MKHRSTLQITFTNNKRTATHYNKIADGLLEDFEYGDHHVVRYKDSSLFIGYQRENIHRVVYMKT